MITGVVSSSHEAVLQLKIQGPERQEIEIDAVIDTGFTGTLTLPSDVIAALGLPWISEGLAELANGQIETFDVYAGNVIWDGAPRRITIGEANTDPLVGMTLMYGYDLNIQNVDGGVVTLQLIKV